MLFTRSGMKFVKINITRDEVVHIQGFCLNRHRESLKAAWTLYSFLAYVPLRGRSRRRVHYNFFPSIWQHSCKILIIASRHLPKGKIMEGIQYIIDDKGKKKAVIIDLKKHGQLWEDLEDSFIADQRADEPRETLETVKEKLKNGGKGVE